MRLETVVVGDINDDILLPRLMLDSTEHIFAASDQRLFDKRMLAVGYEVVEEFYFRGVWNAEQCGIVGIERDVTNVLEIGLPIIGIDRRNKGGPRKALPLVPLHSKSNDDDSHRMGQR